MDELLAAIAAKKERLDRLRPVSREALANLEHYYDIELTYTSSAIEGNTLSPVETALVIEQGMTIGGKSLKDHLEALDHYDAIRYVRELARQTTRLTEGDVRNLHSLVMRRSRPDIAGGVPILRDTSAPKPGGMRFRPRRKSPRLWVTSPLGSARHPARLTQRSWRIAVWWTFTRSMTATDARPGS